MIEKKYEQSHDYSLATQLKTWMSLNPSFGCIWDCAYCIQHRDKFYDTSEYIKVNKVHSWEDTVGEMMKNPRITSKTPLTFYNFSDPFLPQNTGDLKNILRDLDGRDFKNVVGLITRTYADKETLDVVAGLKNLRPVVLVTYAGYEDKNIELAPSRLRVKLMQELHERGVKTLLYFRPVIKEWMVDGQIEKVRDKTQKYIDGVVMSGILMTPEIISKIKNRNLIVPFTKNFENKHFPVDIQDQIIKAFTDVPVFRYTSCGVSSMWEIPDFNSHLGFLRYTQKKFDDCTLPCTESQRSICKHKIDSIDNKIEDELKDLLNKIGLDDIDFKLEKNAIVLDTELSKEDITFLRHNLSSHVDYEGKMHHIDQVAGSEVVSQK